MLMLLNSLFSSFVLMPFILLGMAMVGYNTYKFFRTHPLLGQSGKAEAVTSAAGVLVISALIVAIPHGFLGKVGIIAMVALAVNVIYVLVALYYLKKWVMKGVRSTQDELTQRASALHTTAFQKATMGMTALLLADDVGADRLNEITKRIKDSSALSHLPSDTLIGYFTSSRAVIAEGMFGWEDMAKKVRELPAQNDESEIALRVAITIVGGKKNAELDRARLQRLLLALNVPTAPDFWA